INRADSAIAVKEIAQQVFQRTAHGMRAVNPLTNVNSDFNTVYVETRTTMAAMNRNFQRGSLVGASVVNFVVPEDEAFFIDSQRSLEIARVIAELRVAQPETPSDAPRTGGLVSLPLGPARLTREVSEP
ncbi:hypothetical protein KJ815_09010, partial [bacterium]|nr:hypothetical protein [bacterium]